MPTPDVRDRYGNLETPYVAGKMPDWLQSNAGGAGGLSLGGLGQDPLGSDPLLSSLMSPSSGAMDLTSLGSMGSLGGLGMGMPGSMGGLGMGMGSEGAMGMGMGMPGSMGGMGMGMPGSMGGMGMGMPGSMGGMGTLGPNGAILNARGQGGNAGMGMGMFGGLPHSSGQMGGDHGFGMAMGPSYKTPIAASAAAAAKARFSAKHATVSSMEPTRLANGMTMRVPHAQAMRFKRSQGKVIDPTAPSPFRKAKAASAGSAAAGMRGGVPAPPAAETPIGQFAAPMRFRATAGTAAGASASAKMAAIMQQKAKFGYDMQNAQSNAALGFQTAMNLQGSLLQQQQQMAMAQHMAMAQQQYVQNLQRRMAALDLVQKRVAAGSHLEQLMQQFQRVQMVDQALDLRRTAEMGLETELIKSASAVDGYMREASSTIMSLMSGNGTNATSTSSSSAQPESAALKLLDQARSLSAQAQKARVDARQAFFKQLQLPLGAKAAAGGEAKAGAEAAKFFRFASSSRANSPSFRGRK